MDHTAEAPAATHAAEVWLRGATPRVRSGTAAKRTYPTSEVRGRPRMPGCDSAGAPRGATPSPRSGTGAESARPPQRRSD